MVSGINHLTWNVVDIDEAFGFYVASLGFKPVMKSDRSAYLLAGDVWIAIVKGAPRTDDRYDHIAFQVDGERYAALVADLIAGGVQQWQDNASEGDSFYFLDTSGNRFELHCSDLQARIRDGKANWGDSVKWYD